MSRRKPKEPVAEVEVLEEEVAATAEAAEEEEVAAPAPRAGKLPKAASAAKLPSKVYTYIGKGEDPPRKINFMGLQEFTRGKAVEVTDQIALGKLKTHPCFVEGEVEMEDLHDQDAEAVAKAEKQRKE